MATPDLTSGQVMDQSAALLNDTLKTVYTYAVQVPYLNMALQELQELFEQNEVPVTGETTSTPINIAAGVSSIGFATTPALPSDLVEPSVVWISPEGEDQWMPIGRVKVLPEYMVGIEIPQILQYTWEKQAINFLPANADNDLKINYVRALFTLVTDETSQINVINAASFLQYRTAALCAEFIGENKTRSDELNVFASLALDRALGIGAKGRQATVTRRRPFRSNYKRRSFV